MPFLYHITSNGSALERWKIDDRAITVGRGDAATAQVTDECLSRAHFRIHCCAEGFIIQDLNSKNGTWINGGSVHCDPLPLGARIQAGRSVFLFEPGLQTALDDLPAARTFFRHLLGAELAQSSTPILTGDRAQ